MQNLHGAEDCGAYAWSSHSATTEARSPQSASNSWSDHASETTEGTATSYGTPSCHANNSETPLCNTNPNDSLNKNKNNETKLKSKTNNSEMFPKN